MVEKSKRVSYTNQVYAYVIVLLLYVDLLVELGSEDKGKNKKGIFFCTIDMHHKVHVL